MKISGKISHFKENILSASFNFNSIPVDIQQIQKLGDWDFFRPQATRISLDCHAQILVIFILLCSREWRELTLMAWLSVCRKMFL